MLRINALEGFVGVSRPTVFAKASMSGALGRPFK